MEPLFKQNEFYDPISGTYQPESEYLLTVFSDDRTRWFANMITRYRHYHVKWWDRCWGRHGGRYQGHWFGDYDEEKAKVNETAKRQIIRKCSDFIIYHDIGIEAIESLQNTGEKTLELLRKKIVGKKHDMASS